MACPFFLPIARLTSDEWIHAPRLPLGDPYRGECRASADPVEPPLSEQTRLCNCGYARGRCSRLPDGAADAVRFSMRSDSSVVWILEHDHAPVEFGVEPKNEIMAAQISAFIDSYRRKAAVLEAGAGA